MSNKKTCIMSNGIGSIVEYDKTSYVHGKGKNAGHKEKKIVKRYRVRYRYIDEFGESRQTSKSDYGLTEAKAFLNELTHDISKGEYLHKKDITVNEFSDCWFSDYSASDYRPNTLDWHRCNIKHIKRGLGEIQVQHLSASDIKKFYTRLLNEDKLSSTYISHINRTLKQMLDFAVDSDTKCIKKNPCRDKDVKELVKRIKRNHKTKCKPEVIKQIDLLFLIEHLHDQPGFVSIALGGLMGLRTGEIRGLKWNDIDFKKKEIHVKHQLTRHCDDNYVVTELKTESSEKTLRLSTYIIDLLQKERQRQKLLEGIHGKDKFSFGFVCVHTRNEKLMGKPFAHNYYNVLLNKGLRDLNLKKMRFHDLRHSYGSNLLYQGMPIHTVSKMMRHANVAITSSIYSKTNEEADDELFDSIIEVNIKKDFASIKDQDIRLGDIEVMESSKKRAYSSPRLKMKIFKGLKRHYNAC